MEIYASPKEECKKLMLEEFYEVAHLVKGGWLLGGDFKDLRQRKKGGLIMSTYECRMFIEKINAYNLIDVSAIGYKYTWIRPMLHRAVEVYERLDRVLCNEDWRILFPNAHVKVLMRIEFYNHHPI
ncbi:uncharacterized protein LOC131598305 [Vicia villosa]|uniref:uncharacterized protein LOC131598305 n=1 Tax=Vicia villosa TaxID=3911 RepID=UPI00273B3090|nr:uncharacterized protein LOC131598305 [Vicia villosa]